MPDQVKETSPRLKARIAGVLYLIVFISAFSIAVRSNLIVRDDAVATAHNILASEQLFRFSFVADLIAGAAYIGVTAILYELLKPVSRTISLTAAFFSVTGIAALPVNMVNLYAPLLLLSGKSYLSVFETEQLQALVYTGLQLHGVGFNISLVFFGFYCLLAGCLIIASSFLPWFIGFLMVLAGLSYFTLTSAYFLFPAFAAQLVPYILAPPLIGEAALALWLVLVGVNAGKWHEQASALNHSVQA